MKKICFVLLMTFFALNLFAQDKEQVKKIVNEGIELHDKGDYAAAIRKYDEALQIDPDDFDANYEKSYSLFAAKNYEECIALCKVMIVKFANNYKTGAVYANYGNALDDMGKADEAIEQFTEGISKFPDSHLLYFNRGLAYMRLKKYKEAREDYVHTLAINPLHPSSNYYLAQLLQNENRIPAMLAFVTFIAIEPQSDRTAKAAQAINQIMYSNIKKDGNNTTISISSDLFDQQKNKNLEDNFSEVDMVFSILATTDDSKDLEKIANTAADKFDFKLQMLINALGNSKKEKKGFLWEHYVPFFIEMKDKDQTAVLSHLVCMSTDNDAKAWIENNNDKVKAFYSWLKAYEWKK
jgi:Tfp pilus assembly protein PilF